MLLTLTVDPADTNDLNLARATIESLTALLGNTNIRLSAAPDPSASDLELAAALQAVVKLDNEDRQNRHGYLRLVAAAGDDGFPKAELLNGHFQGKGGRGYGGTRSSVEKTWQSSGGKAFAKQLIYRSADGGRLIMFAPARQLVLDLIGG